MDARDREPTGRPGHDRRVAVLLLQTVEHILTYQHAGDRLMRLAVAHDAADRASRAQSDRKIRPQGRPRGITIEIAVKNDVGGVAGHHPQVRLDRTRGRHGEIGQPVAAQPRDLEPTFSVGDRFPVDSRQELRPVERPLVVEHPHLVCRE